LEKFIHIKPNGLIAPVEWTAIELPDSNAIAQKSSLSLDKKNQSEVILSGQTDKKKDKSVTNQANYKDSIGVRNQTAKRPIKQKEQVSFGPAY
jgi:hypothetical protein